MAMTVITEQNYEQEVVQSDKPVLIDFWAGWCGPCKMLSPVVEELSGEVDDVKFGKVNVDEEMNLAQRFGVTGIPMLVVLKGGQPVAKKVGFCNKDELKAFVDGAK